MRSTRTSRTCTLTASVRVSAMPTHTRSCSCLPCNAVDVQQVLGGQVGRLAEWRRRMPNRISSASALTSPSLAMLSHGGERAFWRLKLVGDDFGRFNAEPSVLSATCFPLMIREITDKQMQSWLDELCKAGITRLYTVGGTRYGYFLNWHKFQQPRALKSKFPEPPASDSACDHLQADVSEKNTPRSDSNTNTNTNTDTNTNSERKSDGEPFDTFYAAYPKKEDPREARKVWTKLNPSPELVASIMADFPARYAGIERQYVPQPAKYLRRKLWEGELPSNVVALAAPRLSRGIGDLRALNEKWSREDGEARDAAPGDQVEVQLDQAASR
jgi:hypothetical protein